MTKYFADNALSILSLLISLITFFSTRKILRKTYILNREGIRGEAIELMFVESQQTKDFVILKLVLFNPGNTAALINSFSAYKLVQNRWEILSYFGFQKWKKIKEAKWCPSREKQLSKIKTFNEEYANLYVENYCNIFVSIPGRISSKEYKFSIQTNHGKVETTRIIDIYATESYFPHSYQKKFFDS